MEFTFHVAIFIVLGWSADFLAGMVAACWHRKLLRASGYAKLASMKLAKAVAAVGKLSRQLRREWYDGKN